MGDCHHCGTGIAGPSSFDCRYCGRSFCSSHRMPENHDCPNLDAATSLGPDMTSLGEPVATGGDSRRRHALLTALLVAAVAVLFVAVFVL